MDRGNLTPSFSGEITRNFLFYTVLIIKRLNHGLTATIWRFFTLANGRMSAANFVVCFYFATTFCAFKYWHYASPLKNKMKQLIKTFAIAS